MKEKQDSLVQFDASTHGDSRNNRSLVCRDTSARGDSRNNTAA